MNIYPYLGANVDPVNVKELHYRGLLEEGETLMALFDGVLIDDRGRRIGGVSLTDFVALTDQRLITWARGFFNDTVDGFTWKDVDVVEAKTWDPLHGRVVLAFRLLASTPRPRRITIKGFKASSGGNQSQEERVMVNVFDYMPAADVPVLTEMVGWIGDQVVAGVTGDDLFAAFADTFPLPEAETATPAPVSTPQRPMLETSASKQGGWSLFGSKKDQAKPEVADNPDSLIAAYELQRSGESGLQTPVSRPASAVPTALGQFGFYDISRGMRLLFEGPKRVGTSLNRVNDVIVDTAELIEDLQDPRMRKRTISGLRFAMDMQEQQSGLLGAVAPVVRAVLGGSHHDQDSSADSTTERSSVRRIQVRAAVRQRDSAPRKAFSQDEQQEAAAESSVIGSSPVTESAPSGAPVVSSRVKIRRQATPRQSESADANGTYPPDDGVRIGGGSLKIVSRASVSGEPSEPSHPEGEDK